MNDLNKDFLIKKERQDFKKSSDAELNRVFHPIFEKIKQGSKDRESNRILPFEPIVWLKEARFGALRVPTSQGGFGASLPQLFRLLTELAEADSNISQALRGHFALVEDRLNAPDSEWRDKWLQRFARGDLAGNAWTETGDSKIGNLQTRVHKIDGAWYLEGQKYYSTGSIFADWIDVTAQFDDSPESLVTVAVSTHQDGVIREDDWDGFGQRTTGSGHTLFQHARVDEADILPFSQRFRYQTAFYQLVLLATLTGIGRAALDDVIREVRARTRIYSHGNAASVRDDAQIQQVIGRLSAQVYTAGAATREAAEAAQQAYLHHDSADEALRNSTNIDAELASARAQIVVTDLILQTTSNLFNALGASAAASSKHLDRHWRNARTVSSHNPLIYKEKVVGSWELNGTEPVYQWQIGNGQ